MQPNIMRYKAKIDVEMCIFTEASSCHIKVSRVHAECQLSVGGDQQQPETKMQLPPTATAAAASTASNLVLDQRKTL